MKKLSVLYGILVFVAWSCNIEDSEETNFQKPTGKYLSEIRTGESSSDAETGIKLVEFRYDNNRSLKTIKYYNSETRNLNRYLDLFYNADGLLTLIKVHYSESNVIIEERFSYKNKKLVKTEGYKIENGKTTLIGRTDFKVDAVNNLVEFYPYDLKDGLLVKRIYPQKYYFNTNGNLTKYHYNIGQGGFFETMEDYKYDNKISPFANLDLSYYNVVSAYLFLGECFSMNNVVRHTNYLHENGVSYEKPEFDTIIYKYDGNYPIESEEYNIIPNYSRQFKSRYFYKYIDLN